MAKVGKRWLKRRIKAIAEEEEVEILVMNFEKECEVDGIKGSHYCGIWDDGLTMESVEFFVSQEKNQIIAFRRFIKPEDCDQFPDDLSMLCVGETMPQFHSWIQKDEDGDVCVKYDNVVSAKSYKFRADGKIISDKTALRNDKYGFSFESDEARFLVTVGNQYVI